ncbi:SUKH-4 family immunity protein [Kitasatospora arboriphila]|uniref:SUKH-4 immunity protein of toxin-antitoxin system n=1 Tax=Kitasatospora arboriphila TaxID=258052 RepID=A0ABN1U522_9ACTN
MRFHLAGRLTAADELAAWLERRDIADGVRLVTGDRGAGKSWLLARTALGADEEAREFIPSADGPLPPVNAFVGVADADGETEGEWLRALADGAGLAASVRGDLDYAGLTRALEETARPQAVLLSGVPGRLRATAARRGVPDLVREFLDPATMGRDGSGYSALLLAEVGREDLDALLRRYPRLVPSVIDLDEERFAPDRAAFEGWVRGLLDVPGSVYADAAGDAASAAAALTSAAWPNFLLAEVLAMEVRVRGTVEPGLPRTLEEAWEYVLASFGPAAPKVRQLLAPLVMAEGVLGMPDALRMQAAAAVRGREVSLDELRQVEEAVEAFVAYEFTTNAATQDASTVRHARLRDAALADAALASYGASVAEVQRRLAATVRQRIPDDVVGFATGREPDPAESYALRFGIGHALAGGVLDDWLEDVRVLVLSDPQALAEAVAAADRDGQDRDAGTFAALRRRVVAEAVRLYRNAARCDLAEWVSRLRFAAQMWGAEDLVHALDGLGLQLPWRADWAHWRPLGAFDTRAFAQGWTGPVEVAGIRRADGGSEVHQVCLQSLYDGLHRWYSLADGTQIGEAEAEPPTGPMPVAEAEAVAGAAPVVEIVRDFRLLKVRVTSPAGDRVHALCTPYPGARMHPLPGGRVLLAGHSGAAVITFDPTIPAPVQQLQTTAPNLLPPDGMWALPLQADTDLTRYYYGGVVRADRETLGGAAERQDVAHVLCAVGLPGFPVFWRGTADFLANPRTLADHLEELGEPASADDAGRTVLALSADEETPLCVEHTTGRVVQAETSEPDLVNTSVARFAACQAFTSWALSVSAVRQVPERYEFLDFLRASLTRIDPEAAEDQGADWWWFQAVEDETSYTLYG